MVLNVANMIFNQNWKLSESNNDNDDNGDNKDDGECVHDIESNEIEIDDTIQSQSMTVSGMFH